MTPDYAFDLQSTMGNQAVSDLVQRSSNDGSGAGDPAENEANQVAQAVVRGEPVSVQQAPTRSVALSPDDGGSSEGTVETASLGGSVHTVVRGDTLWGIAAATYGDGRYWTEIYQANSDRVGDGGDLILVGVQLTLPTLQIPVASRAVEPDTFSPSDEPQQSIDPNATSSQPDVSSPSNEPQQSVEPSTSSDGNTSSQSQDADQNVSSSGPTTAARTCLLPALKYNLQDLPAQLLPPIVTPGITFQLTLKLTGSVTIQQQGSCNPLTFDQQGYAVQSQQKFGDLTSGLSLSEVSAGQVSISSSFGNRFVSSNVTVTPPSGLSYSCAPAPVTITTGDWVIKGSLGYTLKIDAIPNTPPPAPVPWYEQVGDWVSDKSDYIVAGGLFAAGAAIVVVTIGEDIVTLGAGVADDPVSFAAAASLFGTAVQYAH